MLPTLYKSRLLLRRVILPTYAHLYIVLPIDDFLHKAYNKNTSNNYHSDA